MCPSTDIDAIKIARSVAFALADRKRKVRRAVLELFAVLAQLMGSAVVLLDMVMTEFEHHPEKERILHVLRNRYVTFCHVLNIY